MRKALLALVTLTGACSSTNAATPSSGGTPQPADASTDASTADAGAPAGLRRLNHVVVIFLENWSFDSLYAEFKGAEGLAGALAAPPQVDPTTGQPYATLPQIESHMPAGLPNKPFALDPYLTVAEDTSVDLTTNFYAEQGQIDDGKMDLFVAKSAAKGLTMGYFHTTDLPLATEAQTVHALRSLLSRCVRRVDPEPHLPDLGGRRGVPERAPTSLKAVLDDAGVPEKNPDSGALENGPLTPDGHVVGTVYSVELAAPRDDPAEPVAPEPDDADDRRQPLGQERRLGVVRRRLERGAPGHAGRRGARCSSFTTSPSSTLPTTPTGRPDARRT